MWYSMCAPERITFAALATVGTGVCMKARIFPLVAFILVMLISSNRGISQSETPAALPFVELTASSPVMPRTFRPFPRVGIESYAGVGGIGFDVATPVSRRFNVRAGSEFFGYSTTFEDQGANVAIHLRMRSGHASLDWFPFGGRFRLSPLIVFANNNRAQATALIPPGNTSNPERTRLHQQCHRPFARSGVGRFSKSLARLYAGVWEYCPAHEQPLQLSDRSRVLLCWPTWIEGYLHGQRLRSYPTAGDRVRISGSGRRTFSRVLRHSWRAITTISVTHLSSLSFPSALAMRFM